MSDIDFAEISMEQKGTMLPGRLKITDTQIHFKPKAGKVFSISDTEIELVNWLRYGSHWGIRIFTNVGTLTRFSGFKEADKEKLAKAFSNRFGKTMVDTEVCVKGWNWGTAKFKGSVLSFDVANSLGFDIPLGYVSQCTTGKNEVTLEFHQNDDARDSSLMELRFHMPSSENAGDTEPVDAFKDQVLSKAEVVGAVGDANAIAIFREIQCLTPRGRYDIKVYQSFFQLHGKTFDYKIPMSTVLRLFLLPHIDGRQMYFVVSLDPPIKQGQTRYPYLVFLFATEEECSIELPFSDKELETKYGGKLEKEMNGPTYEIVSKIMKIFVDRKLTGPGKFSADSKQPAVGCSYKAAAGYLYPLDRGFMFVHKPPIHIRMEEINAVNFVRSGGGTKSFDFEIELKSGIVHAFVSILKEEYSKLYEFINSKGIRIKSNNEKIDYDGRKYDGKGEPDAYLARVKAEAKERSDDDNGDSESSEDEDYNPDAAKITDVSEESDSGTSSSGGEGSHGGGSGKGKSKTKKKSTKTVTGSVKDKEKSSSGHTKQDKAGRKEKEKPERRKRETKTRPTKSKEVPTSSSSSSSKTVKSGKKDSESPGTSGGGYKSKEFISEESSSGSD